MFLRPILVNSMMAVSKVKVRIKFPNVSRMVSTIKENCADESLNVLQYTSEENEKILKMINTKDLNDLLRYDISKGRVLKIVKLKAQKGELRTLDEVMNLDGFGVKILSKFYESLLNDKPAKKLETSSSRKANAFTVPAISEEIRKLCKTFVAVRVGVSNVTWCRLQLNPNAKTTLTHWQFHDIVDKKLHLLGLIERCLYLDYLIPDADCYIFENPQIAQMSAPGSTEQININIQKSQLLSALGFAVAKRNSTENNLEINSLNVFYMKRLLASRLFNTLVGTERVSTENNILELMDNDIDQSELNNPSEISFSNELRAIYRKSEGYQREFLGQTLLLNVAFLRLVLLKCPKSIASVSRSKQSDNI